MFFFYYYNKGKKNIELTEKDNFIIKIVGFNSIFMFFFSLFNSFFSSSFFSFIPIFIGGILNYLFYEYYSTQKVEYTSLSGIIALGQLLFRLLEGISFEDNYFLMEMK
jgi:hypothetical protein